MSEHVWGPVIGIGAYVLGFGFVYFAMWRIDKADKKAEER